MTVVSPSHFIQVAHELGPVLRERAPGHDADGSFVADNYALLKEHKLLSAAVPAELGGGGASHAEVCHMLRELGKFCGSTALALSMHTHLVAATVYRHRRGQPGEALLRKIAETELVLVSTGAGDWVDSVGHAVRVEDGFRVSGVKRFCSGCLVGNLLVTSAPTRDTERGAEVLHFAVPLNAPGVSIREDWDTLGMRGSGSHSVELEDVFVPEGAISLRRPSGQWHQVWNVILTVAPPIYLAPYLGVAERAAELAREAVARREVDAILLQGLGELTNSLTTAQLAWREMVSITDNYGLVPTAEDASRMLSCKTIASNALVHTVSKAVEVVGGSAFFRRLGLERLLRDIQGAQFHPLSEKKQLSFTGRVLLGLPPVGPERA
jgi:alkylation response protein AidB-like acyl-CoA dehydrogenase